MNHREHQIRKSLRSKDGLIIHSAVEPRVAGPAEVSKVAGIISEWPASRQLPARLLRDDSPPRNAMRAYCLGRESARPASGRGRAEYVKLARTAAVQTSALNHSHAERCQL